MATKVIVRLPGEQDYAVRIGHGVMDSLGSDLRASAPLAALRDALLIADSQVAPLYGARVKASLKQAGFRPVEITLDSGEAAKSVDVAAEIWRAMASAQMGRDCMVVGLGGGVVGDLAGFVASTYMRGVQLVQVPTSLLAMVDASVGGKTAINLPEGKNLVGTFYQPSFVCADLSALETLPLREWRCGCAEIAKMAALDCDEFFFWLMDSACELAQRNPQVAMEAIKRCVVFKANVVACDKEERQDVRLCLNYGHTLGHAIEVVAGYGTFTHGEAVAEGMRFAAQLACDELGVAADFEQAQSQLLDQLGLPALTWRAPAGDLYRVMQRDKKARNKEVRFVLVTDVGKWNVIPLPEDKIYRAIERWRDRV